MAKPRVLITTHFLRAGDEVDRRLRDAGLDTEALCRALEENRIAGAALDVFEQEPLGPSPLRELDNVYMSPHTAAVTQDANRASGLMAAENVICVLRGERPPFIVNPEVLSVRP